MTLRQCRAVLSRLKAQLRITGRRQNPSGGCRDDEQQKKGTKRKPRAVRSHELQALGLTKASRMGQRTDSSAAGEGQVLVNQGASHQAITETSGRGGDHQAQQHGDLHRHKRELCQVSQFWLISFAPVDVDLVGAMSLSDPRVGQLSALSTAKGLQTGPGNHGPIIDAKTIVHCA